MPETHPPERPGGVPIEATLDAVSDEALARRIAGGPAGSTDAEEAELYRRFAPRVRLYGRRHVQNDAAADDLAQDVLLLTIERLHGGEVRQPEEIGSFILGTSRMMTRSARRVAWRREALAARFIETAKETTPSSFAALDAPRVAACLRTLAERDRLVVLLTFYADREAPRIAEDLGVSPGAVRAIRHRAMARLRDCVLGQGTPSRRPGRQEARP
jgi:RNA polymerase sigma-70 factor (ECF subfamily)